jgi:hypothetical protein
MRWPRAGIVVGVIGLVLLGAGWWLWAAGAAGPARHASAPPVASRVPEQLLRRLQRILPGPLLGLRLHGSTCFVGEGGFCSITPCVVPVAAVPSPACADGVAPPRALLVTRP